MKLNNTTMMIKGIIQENCPDATEPTCVKAALEIVEFLMTPPLRTLTPPATQPLDEERGWEMDCSGDVPYVAIGNGEPVPEHLQHLFVRGERRNVKEFDDIDEKTTER